VIVSGPQHTDASLCLWQTTCKMLSRWKTLKTSVEESATAHPSPPALLA
jgi:hypothetical protein